MDYALARKLKDAGFPQKGEGSWFLHGDDATERNSYAYVPTLSELIAACGNELFLLWNRGAAWSACTEGEAGEDYIDDYWHEYDGFDKGETYEFNAKRFTAPTPEEAVANLWLALRGEKTNA